MSHDASEHRLPPEYERGTDRERFRPLHAIALDQLDRAGRQYYVRRTEGYGVDIELEASVTLTRATVALAPYDAVEGAIVVAFTTFPGLHVRFGRWCCLAFPSCGCDACGETADDECNRLTSLAENLIAGRFREVIVRSDKDTAFVRMGIVVNRCPSTTSCAAP
jgi:Family of unknown function (DUF6226)